MLPIVQAAMFFESLVINSTPVHVARMNAVDRMNSVQVETSRCGKRIAKRTHQVFR